MAWLFVIKAKDHHRAAVRGLTIWTSLTNYDISSCPAIIRRYLITDVDEQWY